MVTAGHWPLLWLVAVAIGRRLSCCISCPSREAYFSSFDPLFPFFVELPRFHLLPTKVKKTNEKLEDYIIERTKN